MRTLRLPLLSAIFGLILLAAPAAAQIRVGPNLSYDFDAEQLGIGGNAFIGVNVSDYQLLAHPSVDIYIFEDNFRISRLNLDVAYPIPAGDSFTPFVGAGVLIQRTTLDFGADTIFGRSISDTDFGLNFFAGSFFMPADAPLRPFAKVVAHVGGGTGLAVQGGASFRISQ